MIKLISLAKVTRCLRRNSSVLYIFKRNDVYAAPANAFRKIDIFRQTRTSCSSIRKLSTNANESDLETQLDKVTFERVCSETLNGLCDYFEELMESGNNISGSDVSYSDGVLTVKLGSQYGTYVINRQSPNKQIWLSSPTSGPKRYDFLGPSTAEEGKWIYRHTGESMHELLQRELQEILRDQKVDFFQLPFGK